MEPTSSQPHLTHGKLLLAAAGGAVIAALVAGGGVYAYQKSRSDSRQADLQNQITGLRSAATTGTPTASATAAPSATSMPVLTPTASPVPPLTAVQLGNFTFEGLDGKGHALRSGTATYPETGGTGSLTLLQDIGPVQADFDKNGTLDSVVVLGSSAGGTGYWFFIAVVLNMNGQPVLGAQQMVLEDRATVKAVSVADGLITVKGTVRGSGQSSAEMGDVPKTETYRFFNGKLIAQ